MAAVKTSAAATASIQLTQFASLLTPTNAPIPTNTPFPTATPKPTFTPLPAQIAALMPSECEQSADPNAMFADLYGGKACRLPVLSPDRKYLAYVTLARTISGQQRYSSDAVQILRVGSDGKPKVARIVPRLDHIVALEWAPAGKLIIWEYVWEGPKVVFVYDPDSAVTLATIRVDQDITSLGWNPQHTAFFLEHSGEYGLDSCAQELGGYDFENGKRFPDLYKIFNFKETTDDPFGIPYGKDDNLYIRPYEWTKDGRYLWLEITPLKKKEQSYERGPTQVGWLELSKTGVTYVPVEDDPHFNYRLDGFFYPPLVKSEPYKPGGHCPGG